MPGQIASFLGLYAVSRAHYVGSVLIGGVWVEDGSLFSCARSEE
jgi:hypothetical protein